MARALMTAVMCAVFCIGMAATSDSAYAARKRAACEPVLPGKICPPLQTSKCTPCKMQGGVQGCAWSACGPMVR